MKNIFTHLTAKLFLLGAVCALSISSCKKVDLGVPLVKPTNSRGKLPPPAVIYNTTLTVTPTGTSTETTTPTGNTGVYDPNCECYVPVDGGTPSGTTTGTTTPTGTNTETETPPTDNTEAGSCPSVDYPIYAGAGGNDISHATNVGTVTYSNDGVNLYVTATYPGPTCPTEIQVWAGTDIAAMPNSSGGVPFGQFPYQLANPGCGTHTITIPLSSLGSNLCGTNVYVVIHAAMGPDANDETSTEQTAIGFGSQTFGGPRWGWIATYPICCPQ